MNSPALILPSRNLIRVLALWLLSAIMAAIWSPLMPLCLGAGGLIALWAISDLYLASRQEPPIVQRVMNTTLALGEWSPIELRIRWPGQVPASAELHDHHPTGFSQEGLPAELETRGANTFSVRYRVRPTLRGDHHFGRLALRENSPWRAWQRSTRLGAEQDVKVYPNFAPLARHALRAVDYRNARLGLQQRRRRGQGMDFAQLREYREGDAMRQVDWKATTRIGKMISREYQDERDQRILLLVDCGRRMGARDMEVSGESASDGLSHFDHALDAMLMLAYVALKHGDRVGLMTLGGPERYLPAQHASTTVSHILRETYDLQPTLQVSDFEQAAQQLLLRERKRALVVLLTNLRDEDDQALLAAARLLGQRHLVLVASLRESVLDQVQSETIESPQDAARVAAAVGYAQKRETSLRRLRAEGVLCLDVAPHKLAIETVNRYLAVKAASQL